jgi:hypothetical protein
MDWDASLASPMVMNSKLADLTVYYLKRVTPTGPQEHDQLYWLISQLQQVARNQQSYATGSTH